MCNAATYNHTADYAERSMWGANSNKAKGERTYVPNKFGRTFGTGTETI